MCGLHILLHLHEYGKPYLLLETPLRFITVRLAQYGVLSSPLTQANPAQLPQILGPILGSL